MPRKVPTRAAPTLAPMTLGGWSRKPMVTTMPMTQATMPKAGMPSAKTLRAAPGAALSAWWMSRSMSITWSISSILALPLMSSFMESQKKSMAWWSAIMAGYFLKMLELWGSFTSCSMASRPPFLMFT